MAAERQNHFQMNYKSYVKIILNDLHSATLLINTYISDKDLTSLPDVISTSSRPSSSSKGIANKSTIHVCRAIKLTSSASRTHPIHARAHTVKATRGEAINSSSIAEAVEAAGHSVDPGVAHAIHIHRGPKFQARSHAIQTRRAQAVKASWAEAVHAGAHTVQARSKPVHTGPQPVQPRAHPVEPRTQPVQVRCTVHPFHAHPVHSCHPIHAGSQAVHSRAHAVHAQGVSYETE